MATTPTRWSDIVTFSNDPLAFTPKVAGLADDLFAIVWENGEDLFGRHLDPGGSFTGGDFMTALTTADAKPLFGPQIFQQADGRVVVDYAQEFDDSPLDRDVRWHSPSADFTPNASSFGTENSPNDEILLDATARSDGVGGVGSAIAYNFTMGANSFLVMRFVSSVGLQASNQIFVGVHAGEVQQNPALAGRHTGHVVVAYENFNSMTLARDIRFHIYTPLEADVSGEVIVSANNVNAAFPDVVSLQGPSTGNFVVAWQETSGIAFRRYFANGTALDNAPIPIANSAGLLPVIAPLKDGGFMIAWGQAFGTESDASADFDIALQRFDGAGNAVGNRIFVDEPGDQGPFNMDLQTLADGRVILTFNNETGNATGLTTLDYLIFDPRDEIIFGDNLDNTILGRREASDISGFDGKDNLTGFDANDTLSGGNGDDLLTGGKGKDKLTGGLNLDTFDFNLVEESRKGAVDVIKDFVRGEDIIDLATIDAKTGGLDNEFKFIGKNDFHDKKGELHYVKKDGHVFVEGDVNGDGNADLRVRVDDVSKLVGSDFIL